MAETDWIAKYKQKVVSAANAIKKVKRGARIFLGTGCGIPHHLVQELVKNANRLTDNEIVHLLTLGNTPLVDPQFQACFRMNSFFVGPALRDAVCEGLVDYTPAPLSDIPLFFKTRRMPLDVALIQVSPPDEFGYCSLGISVDITKTAAENADLIIAQVNEQMPLTHGDSFLNVKDIDYLVPFTEPLREFETKEIHERTNKIGCYAARLIENESTIELGIGTLAHAVANHLIDLELQDLGMHTEMFSDFVIDLIESGVVTNAKKKINRGVVIASFAMGTKRLYEYLHNNHRFEFKETAYVNNPTVIARNNKMVSINSALEVDLTGQVCADSLGHMVYSGIGGQVDFIRGALRSPGGKAIICLKSTAMNGSVSRIVSNLSEGAGVVTTRGLVDCVITEYGIACLRCKTIRERVLSLIAIAHPNFRNELLEKAKKMRYIFEDEPFLARGTYFPIEYETQDYFEGPHGRINVKFRLIRPDDTERIKHLFYGLSEESIFFRFLAPLKSLPRQTLQDFYYVDQSRDISLVGVLLEDQEGRESGKIIAAGRYLLNRKTNQAEFALLVQDEYQNREIGTFMLNHLMRIAKSKGVEAFIAYVHAKNIPMINFVHKTGKVVQSKLSMEDEQYTFILHL